VHISADVANWPIAEINQCPQSGRYRGQSGRRQDTSSSTLVWQWLYSGFIRPIFLSRSRKNWPTAPSASSCAAHSMCSFKPSIFSIGDSEPYFFIPVFLAGGCAYFVLPLNLFVVMVIASAASFYAHVFFDKEYHVEGSPLRRFTWFRRQKLRHLGDVARNPPRLIP
jgi:hypothetical protein